MPAIKASIAVEDGISVFTYAKGKEGWFVRKWNKHERRYRIKKIDGATTQQEALAGFYKALVSFEQTQQRVNKKKVVGEGATIAELVEAFTIHEQQRVDAGLKGEQGAVRREKSLKPMLAYLEMKGITYPSQITPTTWEDYPIWRKEKMKGTRKTELKDIKVFCRKWLVPHGYLSNEMVLAPTFIPAIVIKDDELDANPAITPDDYKVINLFLRTEFLQEAKGARGYYTRRMFYTFVHLLKNSGCRPSELLAVRRKDVTLTNPKRWSESKQEWVDDYKLKLHIRKTKTGIKRDVVCRSNSGAHLLEFLNFQRKHINNHSPTMVLKDDSLLFGKPEELFEKGYFYRYLDKLWDKVRTGLAGQLEGNKFSERPYTLYSLRSTFRTASLMV
jgi:integrase